ncbi:MAG: family 16 glycoside hydrolase [Candidatus Omnitrophota bacterium]
MKKIFLNSALLIILVTFLILGKTQLCWASISFEDTFSDDNLDGWEVAAGTWSIENQELHGVGAGGEIDAWIYAGDKDWVDYVFEAKTIFINGNAEFVFRSTEHFLNEYRLTLFSENSLYSPNTYVIGKYQDGVYYSLSAHPSGGEVSPVAITDITDTKIRIFDDTISIFLNGEKIFEHQDSDPLENGRIGLGAIWTLQANFDNVVVSNATVVPEPCSFMLFGFGFAGIAAFKRRRTFFKTR